VFPPLFFPLACHWLLSLICGHALTVDAFLRRLVRLEEKSGKTCQMRWVSFSLLIVLVCWVAHLYFFLTSLFFVYRRRHLTLTRLHRRRQNMWRPWQHTNRSRYDCCKIIVWFAFWLSILHLLKCVFDHTVCRMMMRRMMVMLKNQISPNQRSMMMRMTKMYGSLSCLIFLLTICFGFCYLFAG
jgi:hypothetical protein